jgi:methylmalonyl-CoA mutase N-terminal domain/subunit
VVDTLDDIETLLGIDLGDVSVSTTINAPAAIMMASYVVAAEEKSIAADRLSGTVRPRPWYPARCGRAVAWWRFLASASAISAMRRSSAQTASAS